jgi:drug/metabolite transporter (DMT)-like permease
MSQKILIDKMNSENMNLSVFFWASFMTFAPLPIAFEPSGHGFDGWAIFALVALGFITGVSFYIYGIGAKKISFLTSSLLLNVTVLFTLLWSYLFFDEPITLYTILGSLLFIGGIAVVNIPTMQMMSRKRTETA